VTLSGREASGEGEGPLIRHDADASRHLLPQGEKE
jgi:hypothetical protein